MSARNTNPSVAVFCHATGFCGGSLRPVADGAGLAAVECPDLRGHGDNPVEPGGDVSWTRWADDALAAVDRLGRREGDAHLYGFGHSGGGAALLLAEQRRPGTFRGLYLFEPVVFPPAAIEALADHPNPLSMGVARRRADFPSRQAAYDNFAGKPPMDAFAAEALHGYVDHGFAELPDGTVTLKCRPEDEARMYQMAPTSGAWAALPSITCPVVVARGNEASGGPTLFAAPAVEALPNATLEVFDHLGHFGPMEAPDELAAAFTSLIDRTTA